MTDNTSQNSEKSFLLNGQVSNETWQPNERNIYIAIMGMTGTGKSTFISHCTDENVAISDPGAPQSGKFGLNMVQVIA
jgi:ABC-type lipoprotein export system ATPase subunit